MVYFEKYINFVDKWINIVDIFFLGIISMYLIRF